MKVLFVGEIGDGQTSLMRMRALQRLGYTVRGVHTTDPWRRASWVRRQAQRKLQRGSIVDEINAKVIAAARDLRPDIVWAEKQEFLRAETIESIRKIGTRLVHFTPDPYFTLHWKRTRLMDEAIRRFDVLIYCKPYERAEYEALGKPLIYMPLGYCDEIHRPLPSNDAQWQCAVGFLGGWEPRRERMLRAVAGTGVDLKIRGEHWDFLRTGTWTPRRHVILRQLAGGEPFEFHRDDMLAQAHRGGEVYADDYARALTAAKIGLGFLRQVCADQHTTRTFEIPACGSMLLADRTDEHQAFFEEGREAEFFASCDELVEKVKFYSRNEAARSLIADAGRNRCSRNGYAYVHRLRAVLNELGVA